MMEEFDPKDNKEIMMEKEKKNQEKILDFNVVKDLGSLAEILSVELPLKEEIVILSTEQLLQLEKFRYDNGDSLLSKFSAAGKLDVVNFLLKIEGLDINAKDENDVTAAETSCKNMNYECLLTLLQNDSYFPNGFSLDKINNGNNDKPGANELSEFVKQREELHTHIKSGNLEAVKKATTFRKSFLYLNVKNESALFCAWNAKKLKENKFPEKKNDYLQIVAYFNVINLRYKENEIQHEFKKDDDEAEILNSLIENYFEDGKNFHIHNLVTSTKVLGKITEKQEEVIQKLYDYLNELRFVSLLMKVLKYEKFQITYDFEGENVDRILKGYGKGTRGLTDSVARKIYIGAKGCSLKPKTSDNEDKNDNFNKVAGTVAHELCHLAIYLLYDNNAKPYKGNDSKKMEEYDTIVKEIEKALPSITNETIKEIDVIKRAFNYNSSEWHAELIVRVPHILAILGDESAKEVFKSEKLKKLYDYYEKYIFEDCKKYSEGNFFSNYINQIKDLKDYWNFVDEMKTPKYQTKIAFNELEKKYNSYENITLIVTSNIYLCCSLMCKHLMLKYEFHFDKCCLFFNLNAFLKNHEIIQNAYKCQKCDYLVLFTNDSNVDFRDISNYFNDKINNDKKPILIVRSDCKNLESEWGKKILDYSWNDLEDVSKENIFLKEVKFQDSEMTFENLFVKLFGTKESELTSQNISREEIFRKVNSLIVTSQVISPKVLSYLIDEEGVSIGNSEHLKFPGNSYYYYMERNFLRETLTDMVYISASEETFNEIMKIKSTEKYKEKEMDAHNCDFGERSCKLLKVRDSSLVDEIKKKCKADSWKEICFYDLRSGEYDLNNSESELNTNPINNWKLNNISEQELINFSENMQERVIIISDGPGAGKSTVVASLINNSKEKEKKENLVFWTVRINLNDFADGTENEVGLAHLESKFKNEEMEEFLMKMVDLSNCLEKEFFKKILRLPLKMKLFFDGFDEISPLYKTCVMKLFEFLKEHTKAQLWITTRIHEQEYLEDKMKMTHSYKLEYLSDDDQAMLMGKIWKHKLKCSDKQRIQNKKSNDNEEILRIKNKIGDFLKETENHLQKNQEEEKLKSLKDKLEKMKSFNGNGEDALNDLKKDIEEVNLASFAEVFLKKTCKSAEEQDNFSCIPLILTLLAGVAYDNLNYRYTNTYDLYMEVVIGQIDIYLKVKREAKQKNQHELTIIQNLKSKIHNLHEKLACKVIQGRTRDVYSEDSDEKMMLEVGIVVEVRKKLSFTHRTFAEFFYCQWMLTNFKNKEPIVKELEEVLSQSQYAPVRHFLNCKFKISKNEEGFGGVPKELAKEINFYNIFVFCISNKYIEDSVHLWQDIVMKYEEVSDKASFMNILNSICSSLEMSEHVLQILTCSLSDESLIELFDSDVYSKPQYSTEAIEEFQYMLERTICFKS